MPVSRTSRRVPSWVTLADSLTIALVALAGFLVAGERIRFQAGPLFVSVTSPARTAGWALLVAVVRHLLFRRPALPSRLSAFGRWLARICDRSLRWIPARPFPAADDWVAGELRRRITAREAALVTGLMIVLTLVMTYPQARNLTATAGLADPVFSVWRLAWVAHQLARDPLHLFDANILFPAPFALAYSDSLLVPNFVAAPFVWLGAPPVIVHTVLLLASFVLAGVCMYVFVRSCGAQPPAALVAAVAFAYHPYRFDQYCHFEQLFSFWMPLALWALLGTIARNRLADGLLLGVVVAGQYLSGMYLGAFFVVWLVPVWAALAIASGKLRATLKPLGAAAVLALVLVAPTLPPYFHVRATVGDRGTEEVERYSPSPASYLVPNVNRTFYRDNLARTTHEGEKDLFPGIVVVLLALVAVIPPLSAARIAYTLGLLVAFEASLGMHGYLYPFLYRVLVPMRAFRVPGRFSMLVGLSLAMLAAYGVARVTARLPGRTAKYLFGGVACLAILLDCSSTIPLQPIWRGRPSIYRWFDGRSPSAVAELPVPAARAPLDAPECAYMYFSTAHWQRLANGYSGAWPRSYYSFRESMLSFPSEQSIQMLRDRRVDYVVLHEGFYGHLPYRQAIEGAAQRPDLKEVFRVSDGHVEDRIYQVLRGR